MAAAVMHHSILPGHDSGPSSTADWFHHEAAKDHHGLLISPAPKDCSGVTNCHIKPEANLFPGDGGCMHYPHLPGMPEPTHNPFPYGVPKEFGGDGHVTTHGPVITGRIPIRAPIGYPTTHGPVRHTIPIGSSVKPMAQIAGGSGLDFHQHGGDVSADGRLMTHDGTGISAHYDHSNGSGVSHGEVCAQVGNDHGDGGKVCEKLTWGHQTTVDGHLGW